MTCIGLRNEPEKYVLALHARIAEEAPARSEPT